MAVAARREVVRELKALGLSERTALKLVGISASVLRYQPRDDGNSKLRERLKELAGQHRRHGYRMLHDRLTRPRLGRQRQAHLPVVPAGGPDGAPASAQEAARAGTPAAVAAKSTQ